MVAHITHAVRHTAFVQVRSSHFGLIVVSIMQRFSTTAFRFANTRQLSLIRASPSSLDVVAQLSLESRRWSSRGASPETHTGGSSPNANKGDKRVGGGAKREKPPRQPWLVYNLNRCFRKYPGESAAYILGLDVLAAGVCYSLVKYVGASGLDVMYWCHVVRLTHLVPLVVFAPGYQPSADLALAFAVSRPLKQLRLPVELGGAAMLAEMFPTLAQVKLTTLYQHLVTSKPELNERWVSRLGHLLLAHGSRTCWCAGIHVSGSKTKKALDAVGRAVDKYGMAYLVSSRMIGVASVAGLYYASVHGIDVASMLESWGYASAGKE